MQQTRCAPIMLPDGACEIARAEAQAARAALTERAWYRFENSLTDTGAVDVIIDGEIVDDFEADFLGGTSASAFIRDLQTLRGRPLNLHINSPGGLVFGGTNIFNALLEHDAPITATVSLAASIASVIAMAADTIVMAPVSALMIHEPFAGLIGTSADMRKKADVLDQMAQQIAGVYARRGGKRTDWRAKMRETTWYWGEEAVAAGLADRVDAGAKFAKNALDLSGFRVAPASMAAVNSGRSPVFLAMNALTALPDVAADGTHAPMTGMHSHPHSAYGSQGGDSGHGHRHEHNGDANHNHHMMEPQPATVQTGALTDDFYDQAFGVHHTDTTDAAWDDGAMRKNVKTGEPESYYRDIFAWRNPDKPQGEKGSYSFTHHMVSADGTPGAANLTACSSAIGVLNGGRIQPGDSTPWMKDREAIYAHLAAHLRDAGKEPPALDALTDDISDEAPLTVRDVERSLREAGISQSQAKMAAPKVLASLTQRDGARGESTETVDDTGLRAEFERFMLLSTLYGGSTPPN